VQRPTSKRGLGVGDLLLKISHCSASGGGDMPVKKVDYGELRLIPSTMRTILRYFQVTLTSARALEGNQVAG